MSRIVPLAALLLLLPAAARAGTVTAEWGLDGGSTFGSFGSASSVTARGQAFVAGVTGRLLAATLKVGRSSDHAIDLRLSVYAADGSGLPTGEPLASGQFPASSVPEGGAGAVTAFPFSGAEAVLQAGTSYVLVAEPVELAGESSLYFLNGASQENATYEDGDSSYEIGGAWNPSSITDWSFRVEVEEMVPVRAASWGAVKSGFSR